MPSDITSRILKASEKSCTAEQLVRELLEAKEADGVSRAALERYSQSPRASLPRSSTARWSPRSRARRLDDWLRSLNVSAVTRNHYRQLLLLAFNFAVRRKYATENPAEKTAKAKARKGDIGILTVNEAARLLESATPDVLPYLAIGLFAGLRRAEIERLDWSEIDFESGLIEVTAQNSKTAQRRFVTMQPNLARVVAAAAQAQGQRHTVEWFPSIV